MIGDSSTSSRRMHFSTRSKIYINNNMMGGCILIVKKAMSIIIALLLTAAGWNGGWWYEEASTKWSYKLWKYLEEIHQYTIN